MLYFQNVWYILCITLTIFYSRIISRVSIPELHCHCDTFFNGSIGFLFKIDHYILRNVIQLGCLLISMLCFVWMCRLNVNTTVFNLIELNQQFSTKRNVIHRFWFLFWGFKLYFTQIYEFLFISLMFIYTSAIRVVHNVTSVSYTVRKEFICVTFLLLYKCVLQPRPSSN